MHEDCTSIQNQISGDSVQSLGILVSTKIIVLGHYMNQPHGLCRRPFALQLCLLGSLVGSTL